MSNRPEPLSFSKALAFIYADATDLDPIVSSLRLLLPTASDGQTSLRLWSALPRSLLGAGAQGTAGNGIKPFDLILEARAPHATLLAPQTFAVLNEARTTTPFRAEILAGTDYVIMPGNGHCALFCPLVRRPHLNTEQFSDYWLNVHADFGRRDPDSRYAQLHASPDRTSALIAATSFAAAPFDGVAQAYFTDPDELRSKLSSPEIAIEAYEDERRFLDHERSAFLPFERLI